MLTTLLLLLACGTAAPPTAPPPNNLVGEDAASALALVKATPNLQILDVRTPREFSEGHLEGAVNIDVLANDFEARVKAELDVGRPVLVHCQSGGRSQRAVPVLQGAGFQQVHHLDVGYAGWAKAGNPTGL